MAWLAFWLAAALLVYVWLGYPLLLRLRRGRAESPPSSGDGSAPRVSVIVAAYNEAGCIRAKLDTTLAQRYPGHRLETWMPEAMRYYQAAGGAPPPAPAPYKPAIGPLPQAS